VVATAHNPGQLVELESRYAENICTVPLDVTNEARAKENVKLTTVTKLDPFERFVLVMSIVERHSNWDCALLLSCSMNEVVQGRMKALCRLPDLVAPFRRADGPPTRRLGVTA